MKFDLAPTAAATVAMTLGLIASPGFADEAFVLATSKAHKLHVTADGGGEWCKPTVRLRMVLETDSPDSGNRDAQIAMMNRLKAAIQSECKTATAAEITVSGPGAVSGTFAATAIAGWVFAGTSLAAAAVSPPPTPPVAEQKTPPTQTNPTPAPAPAQTPATAAVQHLDPPTPAPRPPRERGYASALLAYVAETPALAEDGNILKLWASYRYPHEYQEIWNQEFRLRQLLDRAKTNLAETMSQNDSGIVTIFLSTAFGEYDFKAQRFPVALKADRLTVQSELWSPSVTPPLFILKVPDLDLITGLPMDTAAAQAFVEKRTRYGNVDRRILVSATIRLNGGGFAKEDWGNVVAEGRLENAAIFDDMKAEQVIYQISPAELEKIRADHAAQKIAEEKAAAERQAEQRKQQIMAQRQQNITMLANSPDATKLANWISTAPLNFSAHLDDLRAARTEALLDDGPVSVTMLVQMDASGKKNVNTKWPGQLQVTVVSPAADLKSSGWYLVEGKLTALEGDPPPATQLSATAVYACIQPKCAEATDAIAIVDRKIAGLVSPGVSFLKEN